MSDSPRGDGWWLATDGRYYPPEQHPDYQLRMQSAADSGAWAAPDRNVGEESFTPHALGHGPPPRPEVSQLLIIDDGPSPLRIIVGSLLAATVSALAWYLCIREAALNDLLYGGAIGWGVTGLAVGLLAAVMAHFLTDGGRWTGMGPALLGAIIAVTTFGIASSLALDHSPPSSRSTDYLRFVPAVFGAVAIFAGTIKERRRSTISGGGAMGMALMLILAVGLVALVWWRSDAEPTWCNEGLSRAREAVTKASVSNLTRTPGSQIVTPSDVDSGAFDGLHYDWIQGPGGSFTLLRNSVDC